MSSHTGGSGDPQAGKHILWVVGGFGLTAVVVYGFLLVSEGREAPTTAPSPPPPAQADASQPPIFELVRGVERARTDLDVAALARFEEQLARAAAQTTMRHRAVEAKMARLEALSTRALEAAVRARQEGVDEDKATRTAEVAITQGRSALAMLRDEPAGIDAARLRAAEARLDLAAGEDITTSHPVVLLPTYRDPELRLAALSRPVWFESARDRAEVVEVVDELERAERKSALTRSLLAVALRSKGEDEAALNEVEGVLARVPNQPLALSLKRALTPQVAVAAAVPPPRPPSTPVVVPPVTTGESEDSPSPESPADASNGAGDSVPTPAPKAEPPTPRVNEAKPSPESPEATPAPRRPRPAKPSPRPERAKPKDPQPQPTPPPKPAAKDREEGPGNFSDLVARGCQLVRSGDPQKGLVALREAFDLKPGSTKVTLCMAEAQGRLGRDASARALVDRVLRSSPKNVRALLLAGELAAKVGNKTAALNHYRRVLQIDPNNAKAKAYIERNG